jgi:N-acetyl-gamma-glutamyl-phosphate reductase
MITLGIIGATGYTGVELYRLASQHPDIRIDFATSEQYHGQPLRDIFPHIDPNYDIVLQSSSEIADTSTDVVCFCTPDGIAMAQAPQFLERGTRVVDISPDFRFDTPEVYTAWYKRPHTSSSLLKSTVYGIPELNRDRIRDARLVGNPGCYPTSVVLGLAPLLEKRLIDPQQIIVDAKSGVTGAGRGLKLQNLFVEVNDSIAAYNVGHSHRHVGEMEQELAKLGGVQPFVVFSPHLVPMNRGILSTMYVRLTSDLSSDELMTLYTQRYKDESFIRVSHSCMPATRFVSRTNYCDVRIDRVEGTNQAIVTSAIDNLVKGAAGQALQNINVMYRLDEGTGLM